MFESSMEGKPPQYTFLSPPGCATRKPRKKPSRPDSSWYTLTCGVGYAVKSMKGARRTSQSPWSGRGTAV
ncbi:hypothetical protein MFUL124B02_14500 [Myxococcus fulvus 124B02]|nr:hypothetical protein MFUL124B02_14500 [Myxococcus fulvus 124B02]